MLKTRGNSFQIRLNTSTATHRCTHTSLPRSPSGRDRTLPDLSRSRRSGAARSLWTTLCCLVPARGNGDAAVRGADGPRKPGWTVRTSGVAVHPLGPSDAVVSPAVGCRRRRAAAGLVVRGRAEVGAAAAVLERGAGAHVPHRGAAAVLDPVQHRAVGVAQLVHVHGHAIAQARVRATRVLKPSTQAVISDRAARGDAVEGPAVVGVGAAGDGVGLLEALWGRLCWRLLHIKITHR